MVGRRSGTRDGRTGIVGLALWAAGPIFELSVVALVIPSFPDVASHAVFGASGSQFVAWSALLVVLAGVAVTWASAPAGLRRLLAALLWVASGLLAALMLGFLVRGTWAVFGILLAHSAAAAAVIGWLLLRPVSARSGGEVA